MNRAKSALSLISSSQKQLYSNYSSTSRFQFLKPNIISSNNRFGDHSTRFFSSNNINQHSHEDSRSKSRFPNGFSSSTVAGITLASAFSLLSMYIMSRKDFVDEALAEESKSDVQSKRLPEFTRAEVSKHNSLDTGIWVTYKDGVYDITEFIESHPGGAKILLAAGGQIDPFWAMYAAHDKKDIREMLEDMRIGTLSQEDVKNTQASSDPYSTDPHRHPSLIVRTQKPYNAESPPSIITDQFYVPNELFFVRNHLPVPTVDPSTYKLEIVRPDPKQPNLQLTLDDLKNKFEVVTVDATLQCSGNRRSELLPIKSVKGLEWGTTAIGNASWTGVRLRDVLQYAGYNNAEILKKLHHVQFEGLDIDASGVPYASSIPLEKAISEYGDVILAFSMNGVELPRDHGYPLRAVVPGITGARSIKWLQRIIPSEEESQSFWQQNDYKSFPPQVDWHNVDWKSAPAIQEAPIQSAITSPRNGVKLSEVATAKGDAIKVPVQGFAWSGGGRSVIRVDVSADGGKNWNTAELVNPTQQMNAYNRGWAWTQWKIELDVPKTAQGEVDIVCKAVDSSYNQQPENIASIWNLRGVLTNAWHHVHIKKDESV